MSSPQSTNRQTILVVDDNEQIREIERRYLESFGYNVLEAGDAQEAIGLITSGCPVDLVVSDLGMATVGGEEMVGRIRATHPSLKVLYVTGKVDGLSRPLGDLDALLPKPFAASQLAEAVSRLLFGAEAR